MQKRIFYLVLLTGFLLSGCVTIKQPIVTGISNFKLSELSQDMKIKFDVLLKNPNNFGLTLQKMEMDVIMGDSVISSITLDKKQRINPNEVAQIPISVQPKVTLLPQLALSGISNLFKKDSKTVSVKGKLVVRKFLFRKKYSFQYP